MKLIFEKSAPGRGTDFLPATPSAAALSAVVGADNLREYLPLPEVAESEAVRHYTALSKLNYGVDDGFYPLGSCTMKYNPKIGELASDLPGFARLHPLCAPEDAQGALHVLHDTAAMLSVVCGMAEFSLQPAAGAHGELAGLMILKAYHDSRGDLARKTILIPDSAHGTNPASAAMAGFSVRQIPSNDRGLVDLAALRAACGPDTAGLMLTNPNTLGLFEEDILEISQTVHAAGGLLYYDGANLNALLGRATPGKMGFDIVHVNLHKTFATPHGGGGPGSGPVGVTEALRVFLPLPRVTKRDGGYALLSAEPLSIGRVRSFFGNFGVIVRAYCYLRRLGGEGLREVSGAAVLHANYLKEKLKGAFDLPFDRVCMHEFVLSADRQKKESGVAAMDIAKGLIDAGYHPPTVYFPLIVHEAMMIEPTETETPETLDAFAAVMLSLSETAKTDPDSLHTAPHRAAITRPDDTKAAREPKLTAD